MYFSILNLIYLHKSKYVKLVIKIMHFLALILMLVAILKTIRKLNFQLFNSEKLNLSNLIANEKLSEL